MSKRSFFCSASAIAATLAFGVAGTAAAQAQQAATQAAAAEVQEVVVTGSFIRGTPEDAALPVDVIGAEELQKQGSPSPVELMKQLTVSNGVLGDTNQFDARAQGSEGAATVNLRGLGASRSLVLFNGRRVVSAPIGAGAPDINLLPMAAVGRIEVLKEGAAATYGSDAIAGVVNFITRKNVDGFEVGGDYRYVDGSDGDYGLWGVAGKTYDNWNFLLTGGYQHRSELDVLARSFTQVPSYFTSPETGYSTGNAVTAFLPLGPGALVGSPAPFAPVAGLQRDVGCAPLGGTPASSGTTPTCAFNYTPYDNLVEEENRWQLYGEVNYDLTDKIKAHLEGFYAETDTPNWATSPSYLALQQATATTNPAFTSGLNAGFFVPASNPGFALYRTQNPTQIPAFATGAYIPGVLYRPLAEGGNPLFGDRSSHGQRLYKGWRVSGGVNGEFENGLGFDVAATYMEDNLYRDGYDSVVSRLQLALRGLGGAGCNPTTGTPGAGGCQYFNPFSNSTASNYITGATNPNFSSAVANDPELIRWFFQKTWADLTTRLFVFDTVLNGEMPITFAGGQVGWAAGIQYRKNWFESHYDQLGDLTQTPCIDTPNTGTTSCSVRNGPFLFLGGATPADLQGDVWAAFGEVSLPFTDAIQAQFAARYEDYGAKGGSTFNPKLSVRWQITDIFAARATAGTTFRAPPLTSLDPGQVTSLQFLGGGFKAVDIVGNPSLAPEKANTYSVGFIVKAGPFRATIDWWDFDFKNPLVVEPVGGMFNTLFPTGAGAGNCRDPAFAQLKTRFTFGDPALCTAANLSRILTRNINGPGYQTNGIDVLADYDIENWWGGGAHLGGSVTYVNKFHVEQTSVEGLVVQNAFEGVDHLNYQTQIVPIPQWKASVFAEYTRDVHNLRLTVNYIDGYVDQRSLPYAPNAVGSATVGVTVPLTNLGQKIEPFITTDLTYRAQLPWDTTMVLNIDNLFDQEPPFARLDLGYDPFTANPLGRTYKLVVTKHF